MMTSIPADNERVFIGRYKATDEETLTGFLAALAPFGFHIYNFYRALENDGMAEFYSNVVGGDVIFNVENEEFVVVYRPKFLSEAMIQEGEKNLRRVSDSYFVSV